MKFYAPSAVPLRPGDLVFREARLGKLIAFAIFTAATTAALIAALAPELIPPSLRPPRAITFAVAAALSLFALVSSYTLRASLKRSNWLVRYDGNGLFVKFRSYLNHHFPAEDAVVVYIARSEIGWIRRTHEKRVTPRNRGDTVVSATYLDIGLRDADTTELERHLTLERRREAPMIRRTRTKAQHYPVRVAEAGIVRVEWRDHRTNIVPRIDEAIRRLGHRITVADAEKVEPEHILELNRDQQESRLLDMAERGEVLAAVKLAQRLYGLSTTEAKRFVEELSERAPPDPGPSDEGPNQREA